MVPDSLSSRRNSHIERRISMSTPAVGSSRISRRGSCTSARAIISRRFMPPDRRASQPVAAVPERQLRQVFLDALARELARDAVETRLVDDDGLGRLEQVEVQLLRHHADAGLGSLELGVEVVAEHADLARGLVDQRGDDADQRALAGAVRPQHREEVALFDLEIDALQGLDAILVGLDEVHQERAGRNARAARAVGGWNDSDQDLHQPGARQRPISGKKVVNGLLQRRRTIGRRRRQPCTASEHLTIVQRSRHPRRTPSGRHVDLRQQIITLQRPR